MSFNDNAQLDLSGVSRGGGPGRGAVIGGGGGILGIIGVIIYMLLGGNPGDVQQGSPSDGRTGQVSDAGDLAEKCKTGADANRDVECRVVATKNSVESYWRKKLPEESGGQREWQDTQLVLYNQPTRSACGTASNEVGPFYCPLDKAVYIDASFFDILARQFGSDNGALAQEYVVAHEYGHALQDQLKLLGRAQQDPKGPESGGVRVELMADCFAGMWAKDASTTKDTNGNTFMKPLTQKDIASALSAAEAVGDDRIMRRTQGRVSPENFTHGTAEQRQRWFMAGYEAQSINACNTFDSDRL